MKATPQWLPPVCTCPLSESNQHLPETYSSFLEVHRGPRSRKELLRFVLSGPHEMAKAQTDSPRKQKLADNLGKGRKSRAHTALLAGTPQPLTVSLAPCVRAPGEERFVMGTPGEPDHQGASVLHGLLRGAVTAVGTKSGGVFYYKATFMLKTFIPLCLKCNEIYLQN